MKGNIAEGYKSLSEDQQRIVRQALWSVYEKKVVDEFMKTPAFADLTAKFTDEPDLKRLFIDDNTNDLGIIDHTLTFLQEDPSIQSNIDLLAKALALETQTVIACEQEEAHRGGAAKSSALYDARYLADQLNVMTAAIKQFFPDIAQNVQMRRMFFLAEMKQDHEVTEAQRARRITGNKPPEDNLS